jgi:ribosome-associated translation inhibitor RaiA
MARTLRSKDTRRAPMGVAANKAPRNLRGRTDAPETPLAIRSKDAEVDAELREYVAKRTGFKLGKFATAIERITVRFEDLNGPKKGSPADRCAIKVVISRLESVMVEVVDHEPRTAFDKCIDSVERAVRRALEKPKSKARRR